RVCPYCDFAVEAAPRLARVEETAYVDALEREWNLLRERFGAALDGRPRATLYFGGGTPSLFSAAAIERIVRRVGEPRARGPVEITLELNPSGAELARLREFRDAGVTRLSVGLQSLHGETLR